MAEGEVIYSVDASALIHGWRRAYPPDVFPTVWERLDELSDSGRLLIIDEVYLELSKKDDELHDWCKARQDAIVYEIDDGVQEKVGEIMAKYPKLVDTAKGKSGADPFVIALAMVDNPYKTVVTQESGGGARKPQIPYVCVEEDVPCISLLELIRKERWVIGG